MITNNQEEISEEKEGKPLPAKKFADLQRLKLEKLMKNFVSKINHQLFKFNLKSLVCF